MSNPSACEAPMLHQLMPTQALLGGVDAAAVRAALPANDALDMHHVGQREGFRIGSLHLMVGYAQASELADMPAICRLPHAPAWFAGMTNLHGSLVPVFDLGQKWGVPRDEQREPMLLVLGHGEQSAGVIIDGLPARLRPTPRDRLDNAVEPVALAGCVAAVHRIDGADWIDLDCSALLERLQRDLAP